MITLRSKITKAVLGYFMLHEEAELYVAEIMRRLELDQGNLTRKLKELEKEGILKSTVKGKERYYSLNRAYPLLKEYKRIILKTVGLEDNLREALRSVQGIKLAYIFGSYAEDKMDLSSDIDLLVVGGHSSLELQKKISEVQKTLDREINVVSMGQDEYERKKGKDSFLKSIDRKKKIQII